jgi:hypothetical protein
LLEDQMLPPYTAAASFVPCAGYHTTFLLH